MFANLTRWELAGICFCLALITISFLAFPFDYKDGDILGVLARIVSVVIGIGYIIRTLNAGVKRKVEK